MAGNQGSPRPEPVVKSLGRRRRDRKGRDKRGNILHAPGFDRWLNIGMGAAAVIYVGLMGQAFHAETVAMAFRPTDVPKSEVLYGFGRPQFVGKASSALVRVDAKTAIEGWDLWQYPAEGGGTYRFHFDGNGVADEVSCFAPDRGACPSVLGINPGDTEGAIAWRLGTPSARTLEGPSAVLQYASIGVDYGLEQYRVKRVTIRKQTSSILSRIPQFLRFLVP